MIWVAQEIKILIFQALPSFVLCESNFPYNFASIDVDKQSNTYSNRAQILDLM